MHQGFPSWWEEVAHHWTCVALVYQGRRSIAEENGSMRCLNNSHEALWWHFRITLFLFSAEKLFWGHSIFQHQHFLKKQILFLKFCLVKSNFRPFKQNNFDQSQNLCIYCFSFESNESCREENGRLFGCIQWWGNVSEVQERISWRFEKPRFSY